MTRVTHGGNGANVEKVRLFARLAPDIRPRIRKSYVLPHAWAARLGSTPGQRAPGQRVSEQRAWAARLGSAPGQRARAARLGSAAGQRASGVLRAVGNAYYSRSHGSDLKELLPLRVRPEPQIRGTEISVPGCAPHLSRRLGRRNACSCTQLLPVSQICKVGARSRRSK